MTTTIIKSCTSALIFCCIWLLTLNNAIAEVLIPNLTSQVVDLTATLSTSQQAELRKKLTAFEASKGSQVVVLIVPTTGQETIEQYSLRVVEKWRLGRKKIDDGVLLLIAKQDRALRIEVGYGLEGALTDITSKRIIDGTITPYFKRGDFNGGITAGVDQIIRVINGEPLPAPSIETIIDKFAPSFPILIIAFIIIGSFLRLLLGRLVGASITGGVIFFLVWIFSGVFLFALIAGLLSFLFCLASDDSNGGSSRGGSSRGGGYSGGGGFSGGGGSFGGGGASGRW